MTFPGFPGAFGPTPGMGGSVFMNTVAQGGGSLFSGYPMGGGNPAGSIPGLGFLNKMMQPMIHGMMGRAGLVPGQFMGTQNIYDQYRHERRRKEMDAAIDQGAELDIPVIADTFTNIARGMGVDVGIDEQATIGEMARMTSKFTPFLAQMFPDALDKLHGRKGSAAVLARGLMEGGRFSIDPVTGLRGLSASQDANEDSSVKEMMKMIRDTVNDPNSEMSQHGMSMGQAGLLYEELSKKGNLGVRSIGSMTRTQQYERIGEETGQTAAEVEKEATQTGPGGEEAFRTKLRQFDAKRVKSRMEGLSGAVDAMREIFGDLGNPNAPMSQIIEGLNALTQGGIASMPASELERMVRMTKAIADNTGMGIDSIMALTASAAQMGDQLGLHRSLAVTAGQRGAIGGRAVADMGWAGVFGTVSSDEAAAMITKTTEQGMASQAGMGTAAVFRMEDQMAGGSFKAGSRAAKLMDAIKRGDSEFEGKPILDIMTNPQAMRQVFKDSGMSDLQADMYQDFITDPAGNQKYMAENPEIVDAIETMQMQEMGARVSGRATGMALNRVLMRESGLSARQQKAVSQGMSGELAQEIWEEATADDRRDSESWQKFVSSKARPRLIEQLKRQGMSQAAAEKAADRMMPALAAGIEAEGNRAAQDAGYDNFDVALQTMGGQTLQQRQRVTATARQDAAIRGALAPLTSRGPLRELMDIVQEGDEDIGTAVGRILGGIPAGKARKAVTEAMQIIRDNRKKMEDIDGDRSGKWRDADGRLTQFGMDERAKAVQDIDDASVRANKVLDKQGDAYLATQVDKKETIATAEKLDKLEAAVGGDATKPGYEKKVEGAQKRAFKEAGSLVNKFLGDVNSMKQLGKGGLDLVESLEADKGELERLIDKHGSLAAAKKAEPDAVTALVSRMSDTSAEIDRRFQESQKAGKIAKPMTKEEERRTQERIDEARESPDERRQKVLETLADLAGVDVEDLEDEEIMEQLGTGADLAEIEREAGREERRREIEKDKGKDWEDIQAEVEAERERLIKGGMSEEEAEKRLRKKFGDEIVGLTTGGRALADLGEPGADTGADVSGVLETEYGRDDEFREQAGQEELSADTKAIVASVKNIKVDAVTLTIRGDGGADIASGDADETPQVA